MSASAVDVDPTVYSGVIKGASSDQLCGPGGQGKSKFYFIQCQEFKEKYEGRGSPSGDCFLFGLLAPQGVHVGMQVNFMVHFDRGTFRAKCCWMAAAQPGAPAIPVAQPVGGAPHGVGPAPAAAAAPDGARDLAARIRGLEQLGLREVANRLRQQLAGAAGAPQQQQQQQHVGAAPAAAAAHLSALAGAKRPRAPSQDAPSQPLRKSQSPPRGGREAPAESSAAGGAPQPAAASAQPRKRVRRAVCCMWLSNECRLNQEQCEYEHDSGPRTQLMPCSAARDNCRRHQVRNKRCQQFEAMRSAAPNPRQRSRDRRPASPPDRRRSRSPGRSLRGDAESSAAAPARRAPLLYSPCCGDRFVQDFPTNFCMACGAPVPRN
eukprot:TRINITY_DN5965_c0_g1_i1.p1 TRINITY_DN5965_c0_g1~~TRINITY_DN5965_c0_g1_i1.p1  ORF type:complete len:403 (+),score=74.85 TRINITY_DN5965_c0_g1_i1:80-1210(+)